MLPPRGIQKPQDSAWTTVVLLLRLQVAVSAMSSSAAILLTVISLALRVSAQKITSGSSSRRSRGRRLVGGAIAGIVVGKSRLHINNLPRSLTRLSVCSQASSSLSSSAVCAAASYFDVVGPEMRLVLVQV